MMKAFLALLSLTVLTTVPAKTVNAGLILDSIETLNWDRVTEPGSSSLVTFRVSSNPLPPAANQMNAFSIGLRIVARNGAVGSLAVQSVVVPDSNPVFANYAAPPALVNVGGGLQTVSGDNSAFQNVTIPASGLGLFRARFFSQGNDALGTFDVYADRQTSNYFTTTDFDGLKFSNVPEFGGEPGVLLGSINVTAVPEPTSVLLVTTSLVAWALVRRHRRKHQT